MGGFVVLKSLRPALATVARMVLEAVLLALGQLNFSLVERRWEGAVGWLRGVFELVFDEHTHFMRKPYEQCKWLTQCLETVRLRRTHHQSHAAVFNSLQA